MKPRYMSCARNAIAIITFCAVFSPTPLSNVACSIEVMRSPHLRRAAIATQSMVFRAAVDIQHTTDTNLWCNLSLATYHPVLALRGVVPRVHLTIEFDERIAPVEQDFTYFVNNILVYVWRRIRRRVSRRVVTDESLQNREMTSTSNYRRRPQTFNFFRGASSAGGGLSLDNERRSWRLGPAACSLSLNAKPEYQETCGPLRTFLGGLLGPAVPTRHLEPLL